MGSERILYGLPFASNGHPDFRQASLRPHHHRPAQTRLLIRLLEEVWFPGHACHALLASLFASLFAGKREATSADGGCVAQDGRGTLNAKR